MRTISWALLVAAVGACGGDDVPTIETSTEFATQAESAACAALFRCAPSGGDLAMQRAYLGDANRCAGAKVGAALLGWGAVGDLLQAQRAGLVRYDGAAAARCIARIRATCDVQHTLGELCPDVFAGTVAAAGSCFRHEECAGGGWCDRGQATGMSACPGQCAARKRIGETCRVNDECAPQAAGERAECFPDATGRSRCVRVTTGPRAAAGQPCGHIVGSSYSQDIQCEAGVVCVMPSGALAGTCQAPAAAGASCASGACAEGAACASTTTMRCLAVTVRRAAGEACNTAMMQLCDPYARLACRAGACVVLGDGTMGAACSTDVPASVRCNAGLYCAMNRCAARKPDGDACMVDAECQSDACDRGARTCTARTCR